MANTAKYFLHTQTMKYNHYTTEHPVNNFFLQNRQHLKTDQGTKIFLKDLMMKKFHLRQKHREFRIRIYHITLCTESCPKLGELYHVVSAVK